MVFKEFIIISTMIYQMIKEIESKYNLKDLFLDEYGYMDMIKCMVKNEEELIDNKESKDLPPIPYLKKKKKKK